MPLTRAALGPVLAERFPGCDPESLGYAATWSEPVVQVPPRGVWHASGQAAFAPVVAWLGREARRAGRAGGPAAALPRRLRAGDGRRCAGLVRPDRAARRGRPAAAASWSLLVDDDGRELLDLPDAPRPDDDAPAPVRFVPEYDNLLLSHADRSHVIADEYRPRVFVRGALLVDGYVAGAWKLVRRRGRTTLALETFRSLRRAETADVDCEAHALLGFVAPDDEHCIETVVG